METVFLTCDECNQPFEVSLDIAKEIWAWQEQADETGDYEPCVCDNCFPNDLFEEG